MRARVGATGAHPAVATVLADGRGDGVVTHATSLTQRRTTAVWSLAARANPAGGARACRQSIVAATIARAALAHPHALWARQATGPRCICARQTRAIAGAAWVLAEGAPVARQVVADTQAADIVVGAVPRAHDVAAHAVPAGLADTVARVHRHLRAVRAWVATARPHPALATVETGWREHRGAAHTTMIAVGAGAVERLATWASPARVARAGGGARIAVAIATARCASEHARRSVQITIAGTARHVAVLAPVAHGIVADAQPGRAVVGSRIIRAVAGAFRVTASTHPAGVADTHSRIGRRLNTHETGLVATGTHPRPAAVLADGRIEISIADTSAIAVGDSRAVWCPAAWPSPALAAQTSRSACIAQAVACTVASNAWTAWNITQRAAKTLKLIAHA